MPKVEVFDKALVLEQATHVFHDKGYHATSMQDLVDATGLNRSSIYNSFDNKLNLFMACLKAYQTAYGNKVSNELEKATDSLEAIERLFKFYLKEIVRDTEDKGCLLVNATSEMANQEPCVTHFLNSNKEGFMTMLEELVQNGQQEGCINLDKSPKEYALYLFSSIQGLRTTAILIANKKDLQSIINITLRTII